MEFSNYLDSSSTVYRVKTFLGLQMATSSLKLRPNLILKNIYSKTNTAHILQLPDDRCYFYGFQETTSHLLLTCPALRKI
jgi:hypothetical protein